MSFAGAASRSRNQPSGLGQTLASRTRTEGEADGAHMAVKNDSVDRVAVGRTSERLWTLGRQKAGFLECQRVGTLEDECAGLSGRCRDIASEGGQSKGAHGVGCSMRRGGERSSSFACEWDPCCAEMKGSARAGAAPALIGREVAVPSSAASASHGGEEGAGDGHGQQARYCIHLSLD
jgi:hypothetical protein